LSGEERSDERWLIGASIFVGMIHVMTWVLSFRMPMFNLDEHQHTHLAWHFANGRLIYRDVFDHHGPLLTVWNGLLLSWLPDPERFDVVFLLRAQNLPLMGVITWATVQLAYRLGGDWKVAAWAGTLVSGAVVVADKGVEVRPDTPQTAALTLGYMVLAGGGRHSAWLAGVWFGLAAAFNAKALAGPGILVAVWCGHLLWAEGWRAAFRAGGAVAAGTLGVLSVMVACFWWAGAARDLIYYTLLFNLRAVSGATPDAGTRAFFSHALVHQTPLVLLMITGLAGTFFSPRMARLMPLWVAVLAQLWTGYTTAMYSQFYVAVMPLAAAAMSVGTMDLVRWLGQRHTAVMRGWTWVMVLTQVWLTAELFRWYQLREPDPQPQRDTEWVLKHLDRDDPVAWLWNRCAGFQFNMDAQYFWCPQRDNFGEAGSTATLGKSFREALEDKEVKVIIGRESDMLEVPEATRHYIRSHYVRLDSCVLVRSDSPLAKIPIEDTDE
jgi:hypothetical protein